MSFFESPTFINSNNGSFICLHIISHPIYNLSTVDFLVNFVEFNNSNSLPTGIKSIIVESRNNIFRSIDGVLFDYENKTLIQYPAGNNNNNYIIPSSVTSIGNGAFGECKLTTVVFPIISHQLEQMVFINVLN